MVSQSLPVESRTFAKCTQSKKALAGQGQGTTNEAGGRMAQSAATGCPISTAERFSV